MTKRFVWNWICRIVLCGALFVAAGPAMAANRVDVRLVSSVEAVAPGVPFQVALEFTITPGWHIYWKNPGDSGMPPEVTWQLPTGFEIGPVQFPVPKKHVGAAALVTNILEGKPVLVATVRPPTDLASLPKVQIAAQVTWLVCQKQCLREKKSVRLTIATVGSADDVKPANKALFQRARRALPVKGPKGKFVTLRPHLAGGKLAASSRFLVNLEVNIRRGFHIQSDKPRLPGLIATEVFLAPTAGVFFDPPEYPAPKLRTLQKVGKVAEFEGTLSIRVPAETEDELPGDWRMIEGLFVYQACANKTGTCYPREAVEWSLKIPMGAAGTTTAIGPTPARGDSNLQDVSPDVPKTDQVPGDRRDALYPTDSDHSGAAGEAGASQNGVSLSSTEGGGLTGFLARLGLPGLLLGCFIYGLFLNATPCVLPVLSIKVLGFVQQAHESRRRTFVLGLGFGVGVLVLFLVLGFLAAAGKNVLQYPVAVIGLSAVVMALALSMLGVYTLQVPTAATKLEATIGREGLLSSFGKGALAPVLGFACTGPLLAAAFGWATQQPPRLAVFAFLSTGLGMAAPYMLLGAFPNWLRFLPKPGQWMITFERIMGFLLLAMVIWLLHPLITQIGSEGLEWTLAFLVAIGTSCWLLGRIDLTMPAALRWRYRTGASVIVVGAAVLVYGWIYPLDEALDTHGSHALAAQADSQDWSSGIPWRPMFPQTVEEVVASGKMAFVDFTAAYCTVCKANKAIALTAPEVLKKMREMDIVPFQGDFTTGDPRVFAILKKFGRAGVPLDLIYPAGEPENPIVLRPSLTVDYVLQKLDEAGSAVEGGVAQSGRVLPSK